MHLFTQRVPIHQLDAQGASQLLDGSNFEAEAEGISTDAVIENILATLPVRVE